MSSDSHDHDGPHEGLIKTPKQLILAVVFAFVVPIFLIVLLVKYVATDNRGGAGSDGLAPKRWRAASSRSAASR